MERQDLIWEFLRQHPFYDLFMALAGLAAFVLVGFFGYPGDHDPFGQPWPLYVWFCVLALTLECLIFSHTIAQAVADAAAKARSVRQQKEKTRLRAWFVATLVMSVVAMSFVGAVYFYHPELINALTRWFPTFPAALLHAPLLFTVFNFLLFALLLADVARRWIRCVRGERLYDDDEIFERQTGFPMPPLLKIGDNDSDQERERKHSRLLALDLLSLMSADFIAGGILSVALAVILQRQVLSAALRVISLNRHLEDCTVSLPAGPCPGTTTHLTSLTSFDVGILLVCAIIGLFTLFLFAGYYRLQSGETGQALLSVMLMALIFKLHLERLVRALRYPLWAFLIVAGAICLALATSSDQHYLQHMQTAARGFAEWPLHVTLLALVLVGGVAATLAVALAASLAIFRADIAGQWLREMRWLGLFLAEVYWIAALVLSALNLFSLYIHGLLTPAGAVADPTHPGTRLPFPLLAMTTILSAAYVVSVQVRRWRERHHVRRARAGAKT